MRVYYSCIRPSCQFIKLTNDIQQNNSKIYFSFSLDNECTQFIVVVCNNSLTYSSLCWRCCPSRLCLVRRLTLAPRDSVRAPPARRQVLSPAAEPLAILSIDAVWRMIFARQETVTRENRFEFRTNSSIFVFKIFSVSYRAKILI